MALVGDLASVDLAQVFQVLTQNQKDGVLEIFRGQRPQALRFRRGSVTLQFDRDEYEERAIEIFRKLGRISEEKLHLAAANRAGSDAALLDVLVEMGILDSDDLLVLFRERMAEEMYDFFAWNEGRFEFHEGAEKLEGSQGEVDGRLYFPADGIVMEAARRVDEWARIREIIVDDTEVFAPAVQELAPEDDLQAAIFREIDGARSISDITQKIGRSTFEVQKTFARLLRLNAIVPVPPEEFPERARATNAQGRPREAAHLFDLAAAHNVDIPNVIQEAARCWEEIGEPARAADRFVTFGDRLVESNHLQEAAAAYRHAHALVPTHLEAWKRAVLLSLQLIENGESAPPPPSPHALADICKEIGQTDVAAEVLNRMIQIHPRDTVAKRALVGVLESTGDREKRAELLESIANDQILAGDPMGAASSLQIVQRLSPGRKELSSKIRELYRRDERRRKQLRVASIAIVFTAMIGSVAFYLYSRNEKAKVRLATLDIDSILKVGDFTRARRAVEDFCSEFKFTFPADQARAFIDQIDAAESEAKELQNQKNDREQKARQGRMNEARLLATAANQKVSLGDLAGALGDLRRALAVAPPDWDQASSAKKNVYDLDRYLSEGSALGARLEEKLTIGDMPGAREIVTKLIASYPRTPEGASAKFPVQVSTDPPGATLTIDGELYKNASGIAARTPAVIFVSFTKNERALRAELPGFSPATIQFEPSRDANVSIHLGRAADLEITLPGPSTAPPAVLGDVVYVPLAGSRLAAYGASQTPAWIVSIASSGEIMCSPRVESSGVFVATTDGVVAKLSHDDGRVLWHLPLKSNIRVAPVLCAGGIIVATDDGKLRLFDRVRGDLVKEWHTLARPSGSLAIAEPAIAVGLPDGKIQIIVMNAQRPEEKTLTFGAHVSGMAMMDDVVIAAGDDGRIVSFEWRTGNLLWETPGGRIAGPRPLIIGEKLFVDRAGRLAAIDPHHGEVLSNAGEAYTVEGAIVQEGGRVVGAQRDGSVLSFNCNDLSVAWHWPGPEGGGLDAAKVSIKNRSLKLTTASLAASGTLCAAISSGKLFRFQATGAGAPSSRPAPSADSGIR